MRTILYLLNIMLLTGCGPSPTQNQIDAIAQSRQSLYAPILESIEKYYITNNIYPTKLNEISSVVLPKVTLHEDFKSLRASQLSYEVSRDLSFFRLSYGISDANDYELHTLSSYLSLTREWTLNRGLEPFANLEAMHYGEQYKKSLSKEFLTLAVLSLINSAKNSVSPCRNFWKTGVIKAIGPGQPIELPVPKVSDAKEAVMYITKDVQSAYAFSFRSELYPPMTKSLMITVAVYQTSNGGKEWTLLQYCDSSN